MQIAPEVVDITPIQPTPNHGPWQVAHDGHVSNQSNGYPVVVIPYAAGDYPITFTIRGDNNVLFDHAATGGAIWVQANGKPNAAASDSHIHDVKVSTDGKTLTVIDTKGDTTGVKPLKLHYSLNFKNGDTAHNKLDPIILNDGGGKTLFGLSYRQVAEVAAALVAILVIIVVYRTFKGRNASVQNDIRR